LTAQEQPSRRQRFSPPCGARRRERSKQGARSKRAREARAAYNHLANIVARVCRGESFEDITRERQEKRDAIAAELRRKEQPMPKEYTRDELLERANAIVDDAHIDIGARHSIHLALENYALSSGGYRGLKVITKGLPTAEDDERVLRERVSRVDAGNFDSFHDVADLDPKAVKAARMVLHLIDHDAPDFIAEALMDALVALADHIRTNNPLPDEAQDFVKEYLYRLEESSDIHIWDTPDVLRAAYPIMVSLTTGEGGYPTDGSDTTDGTAVKAALRKLCTRRELADFYERHGIEDKYKGREHKAGSVMIDGATTTKSARN
jgi:hypothetical protein